MLEKIPLFAISFYQNILNRLRRLVKFGHVPLYKFKLVDNFNEPLMYLWHLEEMFLFA